MSRRASADPRRMPGLSAPGSPANPGPPNVHAKRPSEKAKPAKAMDGSLKKWTNYWNGWQHRWFELEGATLSYYLSKQTVEDGVKGSINIHAADITADPVDKLRLDVVVAGEQALHLKAPSAQARQEWLVALGSAKSCLASAAAAAPEPDAARTKLCEMRVYCNSLVQLVHDIKAAAAEAPLPDVRTLDEKTALLGDTCDTLIRSMEDCMRLAVDPNDAAAAACRLPPLTSPPTTPTPSSHAHTPPPDEDLQPLPPDSFFATMDASFADIIMEDDGSVPITPFLDSCSSIAKLFDLLGSTAFAPVKMDLKGNIRKLTQFRDSDPPRFPTLQALVLWELERKATATPNSATDALLWLKRGIAFLREFLDCFVRLAEEEEDLSACANTAYALTLKHHHGWVVRGVFSIAVNAMPGRSELAGLLLGSPSSALGEPLRIRMTAYVSGIDRVLKALHNLYTTHNLYPQGLTS